MHDVPSAPLPDDHFRRTFNCCLWWELQTHACRHLNEDFSFCGSDNCAIAHVLSETEVLLKTEVCLMQTSLFFVGFFHCSSMKGK